MEFLLEVKQLPVRLEPDPEGMVAPIKVFVAESLCLRFGLCGLCFDPLPVAGMCNKPIEEPIGLPCFEVPDEDVVVFKLDEDGDDEGSPGGQENKRTESQKYFRVFIVVRRVLRLRQKTHWQERDSFDSPLAEGILGKGGLFVAPPDCQDCLFGLTGSSTRAETGCTDLQLIRSSVTTARH